MSDMPSSSPTGQGMMLLASSARTVVGALTGPFDRVSRSGMLTLAFALAALAVTSSLAYTIVQRLVDPIQGLYLLVTTDAFVLSTWLFVRSTELDERIEIQSHWGGLGGGLGGWRMSRSLVFLGTTLMSFALFANAINSERRVDLRERYRAALNLAARTHIRCDDRGIVDGRLVLRCIPDSKQPNAYADFWNQIKLANPAYDDIVVTLP